MKKCKISQWAISVFIAASLSACAVKPYAEPIILDEEVARHPTAQDQLTYINNVTVMRDIIKIYIKQCFASPLPMRKTTECKVAVDEYFNLQEYRKNENSDSRPKTYSELYDNSVMLENLVKIHSNL